MLNEENVEESKQIFKKVKFNKNKQEEIS